MKTDAFEMRKRAGRRLGEMIAAQKATVDREAAEAELAWARNEVFVAVNAVLSLPVAQWVLNRAARLGALVLSRRKFRRGYCSSETGGQLLELDR